MVVYDYDSNAIMVEPMRSRTGPCILAAFQVLHTCLVAAGLRPQLQRLDNECSVALKRFVRDANVDFQLVPPHVYRRNAAERAIRTFKNHFIAGLCSVDTNFPLHLWDKLLPQAEITLNLLHGSRINPKLSAHVQMHGHFDFNRTPLAPPGIRVLVHIKPSERTTWSPNGADGWYTGPALDAYRCYTIWLWDTRATRVCDTLTWFPTKVTMPLASSNDLILAGVHNIVHALQHPSPGSPLAPLTDSHHEALLQLTTILTSLARPSAVLPTVLDTATTPAPSPEPPLRVAISPPTLVAKNDTIVPAAPPTPTPRPTDDAPLRVPTGIRKTVHFAPLPAPAGPTFASSTGARGKQQRRIRRQSKKSAPSQPAKTVHPKKLAVNPPARVVAPHRHGTRSKHLDHVAACARALLIDAARAPQSPFPGPLLFQEHVALVVHSIFWYILYSNSAGRF
jgi:hypothetical protein